jgi:hypothetical protein
MKYIALRRVYKHYIPTSTAGCRGFSEQLCTIMPVHGGAEIPLCRAVSNATAARGSADAGLPGGT